MHSPETPTSSPERRENSSTGPVEKLRRTVGELPKTFSTKEPWDAKELDKKVLEKLSTHGLTLFDVYERSTDIDRRTATALLDTVDGKVDQLTPEKRREIIAAQVRVTVLETITKNVHAYTKLCEIYREMKSQGWDADPALEKVANTHMQQVQALSEKRVDVATQLIVQQDILRKTPAANRQAQEKAIRSLQKDALAIDRELLRILATEDKNVPGGNAQGVVPVMPLVMNMLEQQYRKTMKRYSEVGTEAVGAVRHRIEQAQALLQERFPGKDPKTQIAEDAADNVLKTLQFGGKPYGLLEFRKDQKELRELQQPLEHIREQGRQVVQRMAHINAVLGQYHAGRAEQTTVRKHFDQAYAWAVDPIAVPKGTTGEADMKQAEKFLEENQRGSLNRLDQHLDKVDKGVLKVGIAEKAETMWNQNGRIFMGRVADKVTTVETAWLPDDILGLYSPAGHAKEYLMGGLYDALGWPRDEKGNPKAFNELTPAEQKSMQEKQKSIETVIQDFRKTKALENVRTSVKAAEALIKRTDLKAENFLSGEGEIDLGTLSDEVVTESNIDALVQKHGAKVVYKMCFVQLHKNWAEYEVQFEKLLTDFHEVIGVHFDFQRYWNEFGDKQKNIMWLLLALAAAAGVVGAVGGYAVWRAGKFALVKTVKGTWKLTKMTAKGTANTVSRIDRMLGDKTIRAAEEVVSKATNTTTKATTAAETAATTERTVAQGAEKVAEKASLLTKAKPVLRFLGHAAFVAGETATVYEIYQSVQENRKTAFLPDRERAAAALEFWKGKQVPGIPGGMSLSTGREQAYKEEVAVLEKLKTVEEMRFVLQSQALPQSPLVPNNKEELVQKSQALESQRGVLLNRQKNMLATLAEEKRWLGIELPNLEQILFLSLNEDKPGYKVNISGKIPGTKFYGGPLDDATQAGAGNRQRHRDLATSALAPKMYADQFNTPAMDAQYFQEQAARLKQRKSTEQLSQEFLALQKDMEAYVLAVVDLEDSSKNIEGVKLRGEKKSVNLSEGLGGTIQSPIEVSPENHPDEIVAQGKQLFLRLPGMGWRWTTSDGQMLGVNQTPEHFGKLSYQGTGKLTFWDPANPQTRFEIEIR